MRSGTDVFIVMEYELVVIWWGRIGTIWLVKGHQHHVLIESGVHDQELAA